MGDGTGGWEEWVELESCGFGTKVQWTSSNLEERVRSLEDQSSLKRGT